MSVDVVDAARGRHLAGRRNVRRLASVARREATHVWPALRATQRHVGATSADVQPDGRHIQPVHEAAQVR